MSGDVAAGNNPGHSRRALHLLRLAHRGEVNIDTIVYTVLYRRLKVVHEVDSASPLWELDRKQLAAQRWELVVVLEGTNENSNMAFQARTSYLPSEILWGHRFEQMQLYRKDNNKFEINFSAFHSTYEVLTPRHSARHLEHLTRLAGRNQVAVSKYMAVQCYLCLILFRKSACFLDAR